jgi:hypothetical protein
VSVKSGEDHLIQKIQAEAVDGKSDLSTLLRKCLVLGSRLGHQELKEWANWELDGYPESSELPDYRILHGLESFGHFLGIAGSALQNVPVSVFRLPEEVRHDYANPPIRQGVRAITEMVNAGKNDGTVRWAWPAGAPEVFDHEGYRPDLHLMQAWINVPVAALVGILDTIRNRVLNFALEIEGILGPDDEVPSQESKETKAAQITQTFHQTIYGPVSNVGTADSISQTLIVTPGDLEGLKARLREKGLPEPDLQELEKAIKADEAEPKPTEHLGKNVANWLGNTVKKAGSGALKLGTDLVATVATKALKDYYGIG